MDDLDRNILSLVSDRWQKVAMIVALASNDVHKPDEVASRIRALVDAGQLEGQGDLSHWRHSEIRLRHSR